MYLLKIRLIITAGIYGYPADIKPEAGSVLITDRLDKSAKSVLNKRRISTLSGIRQVAPGKGAEIAIGFSSIFWNTAWTNNQPPHTLGIFVWIRKNPAFNSFPTEYHVTGSGGIRLLIRRQ